MIPEALDIQVRGVVQGVGFRPFVYRLAQANMLAGWVLNDPEGVEIHLEGTEQALNAFVDSLKTQGPPAAAISAIDVQPAEPVGFREFTIRESESAGRPTTRVSPDLPVCDACLEDLFNALNPRYLYPYINCTNCGPRYSVILRLPYDRTNTTMHEWPLDPLCETQYHDPGDRRFHAQPVACPDCGPQYSLRSGDKITAGDGPSVALAVQLLRSGGILAVKGLGGYHLACDARNPAAVQSLRARKYRKEKPFALMVNAVETARLIAELSPAAESLLASAARPIVVAEARVRLAGVAPENEDVGVMLPYAPLHYLLFAAGAPEVMVMTSANRSSEPIAYQDEEALARMEGIADAFLVGERRIARRVEDSIARAGAFGPMILRRSRGYAPAPVASIPTSRPILAVGADLKNSVTLVVDGQAFVSQHIGDLEQYESLLAFRETVEDLISMYEVDRDHLLVAYDSHPQYLSSRFAQEHLNAELHPIQHHRAHVASVIAERGAWDKRVLGISFDGTGYGDDGSIWGGELFAGSVIEGFRRVAHLRSASLAGGDSAARHPIQAAAGFLSQITGLPDLSCEPFDFSENYERSIALIGKNLRTFPTTSVGRLFDAAAAVLGFTRPCTFEGQAAMWVEHLARAHPQAAPYPFPFVDDELDYRPLLEVLVRDRKRGRDKTECARAFQRGVAQGLHSAATELCGQFGIDTVVLSGGVFQNELLLQDLKTCFTRGRLRIWTNRAVPPNDGGISLGQAALAAFGASTKNA